MQMVTPVALANIAYKYYIVYAIIGLTFVGSVYFLYPETMGQSLERLEDLFQQDLSIRETVKIANKLSKMPQDMQSANLDPKIQVEYLEHSGHESV